MGAGSLVEEDGGDEEGPRVGVEVLFDEVVWGAWRDEEGRFKGFRKGEEERWLFENRDVGFLYVEAGCFVFFWLYFRIQVG